VQDSSFLGNGARAKELDSIVMGVAHVTDHRALGRGCEREKARKRLALHLSGRVVIVVVEPSFANPNHPWRLGQLCQDRPELGQNFAGIVGVNADGGEHITLFRRQVGGAFSSGEVATRSDAHHGHNTGGAGAFQHSRQILMKILEIEVAVRIHDGKHERPAR